MSFRKRRRRVRLSSWVKATLVTREWTPERGLVEHESTLENLVELLERCLVRGGHAPERVTLTGVDGEGQEHTVSFSFASSASRRT